MPAPTGHTLPATEAVRSSRGPWHWDTSAPRPYTSSNRSRLLVPVLLQPQNSLEPGLPPLGCRPPALTFNNHSTRMPAPLTSRTCSVHGRDAASAPSNYFNHAGWNPVPLPSCLLGRHTTYNLHFANLIKCPKTVEGAPNSVLAQPFLHLERNNFLHDEQTCSPHGIHLHTNAAHSGVFWNFYMEYGLQQNDPSSSQVQKLVPSYSHSTKTSSSIFCTDVQLVNLAITP